MAVGFEYVNELIFEMRMDEFDLIIAIVYPFHFWLFCRSDLWNDIISSRWQTRGRFALGKVGFNWQQAFSQIIIFSILSPFFARLLSSFGIFSKIPNFWIAPSNTKRSRDMDSFKSSTLLQRKLLPDRS